MNLINNENLALYVMNVKNLDSHQFDFLLNFADEHIKERVKNIHLSSKKHVMVVANVLRKFLVFKLFKIPFEEQKIAFNENGKPYFENNEIHFNVSHSDDYVACAVGRVPVGVDIQKISKYKENVANFIFNEDTVNIIQKADDKNLEFTKQWAKLESILKLKGTGFLNYKKQFDDKVKQQYFFIENYVISVSFE